MRKNVKISLSIFLITMFCSCKNSEEYLEMGVKQLQDGNYSQAILLFDSAIKKDSLNFEAFYYRAYSYKGLDSLSIALTDLDKGINILPEYLNAIQVRAQIKYIVGDFPGTISSARQLISFNPQNSLAYHLIGLSKQNLGDYEGSIRALDKCIQINPDDDKAYVNRGGAKGSLKDYTGALNDFTIVIEMISEKGKDSNENLGLAYYNRAIANLNLGRISESNNDVKKAADLGNKNAIESLNNLNN